MNNMEPISAAAMEKVNMEQSQQEIQRLEQSQKEMRIADFHQMVGRIKEAELVQELVTVSGLSKMKFIKENKLYKDIDKGITSWESFCNYLGKSRRHVDEQLQNLNTLGEKFLETCRQSGLGYKDMRKLRKLKSDGDIDVTSERVRIGQQEIPLNEDYKEDLQAAIEMVLEDREKEIIEKSKELVTEKRKTKTYQSTVDKLSKELAKHEQDAEQKDMTYDEDAYFKKMDRIATEFIGYQIKLDPEKNPLPKEYTELMRTKYLETVYAFKRLAMSVHDTVVTMYGSPEIDGGWYQPDEAEIEDKSNEPMDDGNIIDIASR